MINYQNLWSRTLEILGKKYSEDTFNEVFGESKKVLKFLNGSIYVQVPSTYIQTKLQTVYKFAINDALKSLTNEQIKFKFILEDEEKEAETKIIKKDPVRYFENNLNELYNFESFVVGESNMFGYRMAMKVAEQPGEIANPLYIFGGVGLGKTHLMQAIGNYILDKDIKNKILYVQANDFIVDYSKAAQMGNMSAFEEKYNDLDVLLVDDIQMLEIGKKSQQEFFKLFNDLYDKKKQIVITSDCPADQLKGIMDRLTSRFSWGMTVDVKTPTLEQRVNILKRKVQESSKKEISIDVLEFIAKNFVDNIRELEGGLNRVLFYSDIYNIDSITLDKAKDALESLLKTKKQTNSNTNFANILSVVADFYNVTVDDIISNQRNSIYVLPRQICMYILKTKYDLPYKKIGSILGGRDHSTIIFGVNKMIEDIKNDNELKLAIESLIKKVDN